MKARWSAFSIVIPLLAASLTISFGIWSNNQQAKNQFELNSQQARNQFELKAAEIVMNAREPSETLSKSRALESLFPGKLPKDFAERFRPNEFSRDKEIPIEARIELFRSLEGKNDEQKSEIYQVWDRVFTELYLQEFCSQPLIKSSNR